MYQNFADFIIHEGVLVSSSNYFTLFYMIYASFDVTVVAVCYINQL